MQACSSPPGRRARFGRRVCWRPPAPARATDRKRQREAKGASRFAKRDHQNSAFVSILTWPAGLTASLANSYRNGRFYLTDSLQAGAFCTQTHVTIENTIIVQIHDVPTQRCLFQVKCPTAKRPACASRKGRAWLCETRFYWTCPAPANLLIRKLANSSMVIFWPLKST
ncbi:hypothetical protein D3C81_1186210 [compost metagenome]